MHYSLFGSGVYRMSPQFLDWLDGCGAYKICFFQDEFYYCGRRFQFLNDHASTACSRMSPATYFDRGLRGYTRAAAGVQRPRIRQRGPARGGRAARAPASVRPVDVGYRGRPLPVYMGRGSQEKAEIGHAVRSAGGVRGPTLDIDTSERGRLYGEAWYEFIASCRYILGVESGVSLFDLEDEVRHEYHGCSRRASTRRSSSSSTARSAAGTDRSPTGRSARATSRPPRWTCQVLFEGPYSGAMEPMVHYIPLRKDYSNFDEVSSACATRTSGASWSPTPSVT